MLRTKIEYGEVSETKRLRPRCDADRLRLRLVPRGKHRATEVTDLAVPHEIGQHVERLLEVRVEVGAMDLVEVDVIRAKAFETCLDLSHDP